MDSDDDGWEAVIKLQSSNSKKRKQPPVSAPSAGKYECSYGLKCRLMDDKAHCAKYCHSSQPPRKKMKQQKLTQESFEFPNSQEQESKDAEMNNSPSDDKTVEIDPNTYFKDLIEKQNEEEEEDDGFNLDKEEIKRLTEKSLSGEFSDDENIQFPSPPKIEISANLPSDYVDHWSSKYVRLPCSPRNTYRRKNKPNRFLSKWYLIQNALASDSIQSSIELEECIRSYQSSSSRHWDFSGMHAFFHDCLTASERKRFFNITLPHIIHIALSMPKLFPDGVKLLISEKQQEITFSQKQLACLLANGFLCTFPLQQGKLTKEEKAQIKNKKNNKKHDEDNDDDDNDDSDTTEEEVKEDFYPSFNFKGLFQGFGGLIPESQAAKWICLLTYFERIIREPPTHNVTFLRKYIQASDCVNWRESQKTLVNIHVFEDGFIEDQTDSLQVDFANRMIGGGVLGSGCVQEEIRFMLSPELLCSLLFTAELKDTECLIIKGSERFCNYTGYGSSFDFGGPYYEQAPVDSKNRLQTFVVGIDALYFGSRKKDQYTYTNVKRELNKAFCGFEKNSLEGSSPIPLATGNWGCGVFGGHFMLKFVIQLMAASQAGRTMKYYTFREKNLQSKITSLHSFLFQNGITVSQLYKALLVFCRVVQRKSITSDNSQEAERLQATCSAFGKKNPPDLAGFLLYYFSLPQQKNDNNTDTDTNTNNISNDTTNNNNNNNHNDKDEGDDTIVIDDEIFENNSVHINSESIDQEVQTTPKDK